MAKFVYEAVLAQVGTLNELFQNPEFDSEGVSTSSFAYSDVGIVRMGLASSLDDIEFERPATILGGTIDRVTVMYQQYVALTVTGLDKSAATLHDLMTNQGIGALVENLMDGDDKLFGSSAGDYLYAGSGDDQVKGGAGNDVIEGGSGRDTLNGGDGRDVITGGLGRDTMTGGAGSDEFFFAAGLGKDVITDFDAIGGGRRQDYVQVTGEDPFTIHGRGHDTILDFGNGSTLTLLGVDRSDFSRADLHYVEF